MLPSIPALLPLLLLFAHSLHAREWTAADGRKLQADFVSATATEVTLKRIPDGEMLTFPQDRLSADDQAFIKGQERRPATATATEEWLPLFNGRDLTGWRANVMPESFSVMDGQIRVNATRQSAHLFYVGESKDGFVSFKNFELEAAVRSEPGSNSGIFIHTDMSTRDAARHLARGYEIQLNSTAKEKRKTGSLYAVVDLAKSPVDESQWFKVRVTVRDQRITIHLNDKQVVDYTEPPGVVRPPERAGRLLSPNGGAIALQAHDPGSIFYFKDIRIKRLP